MSIKVTIGGNDRGDYMDRRSLSIIENLHSHANTASFDFYCNDVADAPVNGSEIIITDDSTKIFAGRILTKEEEFLPPNNHKYHVECVDYHRDLDRKLVNKTYTDQKTGDIVKDIVSTYCTGLTTTNVSDGVTISGSIVFDYMYPSDCIKQLAELSLYSWYIDYDKDLHFFTQAVPNAPFKIDDDQAYYKELKLSYDFSQLRNKVRVRGAGSINITRQDDDSINAIKAIEGGDGIYEHIINDETITTVTLAQKIADADLDKYKDVDIVGEFLTDQTGIKAGQLIEVDSTKRNLSQNFMVQEVSLEKISIEIRETGIPYKPAEEAVIGYKPAESAEVPYESIMKIYYIYRVTIASKLIDLADLLLDMLHQQGNILSSKDTTPPAVPSGLTLSTGMGLTTQATLAWLKAEWSANSEADLSYYELKMKKSADSDFTIVSTKNITFIFYSLEPGVTFDVYIRAIDTSGNASDWSSVESKTTATDSDTPAQLSAPTITAILAGIKITWTAGTEDNISHYKIERQESDNDIDWSGWSTIVNIDTTMWLDLLLTYTKYYRYKVSTVTQTGNSGNPSDPSNSVQPNQAGPDDIVAHAITTDQLNVNEIIGNAAWFGKLTTAHLKAGDITLTTIASDYDWSDLPDSGGHKPADDADVTSASNFVTVTYPADQSGLQTQIDGKIVSWFVEADPSNSWEGLGTEDNYWSFEGVAEMSDGYAGPFLGTIRSLESLQGETVTISVEAKSDTENSTLSLHFPTYGWLVYKGVLTSSYVRYYFEITFPATETVIRMYYTDGPGTTSIKEGIITLGSTHTPPSSNHKGDMWWNTSTKKLKRWSSTIWSIDIEDQKALDAYSNAANAQDTADGKRRVFTAQPTTPYDIGDLWVAGPSGDIKKCKTARESGDYVAADWELASNYDNTGDNTAADIINLPATPAGAGLYATGSYLGYYDGGDWKAYIQSNGYFYFKGDANNYIQWNGSSLAIKGSITLVNTIPNAKVDGLGALALLGSLAYGDLTGEKPPSNADVTLSAINGSLAVTGGGITLQGGGAIKTYGKDSYNDATAGFYLGYASGYKFGIGNSTNYLRWTGTALEIKGRLSVGQDSNEDIYFEDSAITMYDAESGNKKQIYWKYSTVDFARLTYDDDTVKETNLHLYAGAYNLFSGIKSTGVVGLITNGTQLVIGTGNALSSLMFWTGTKQLYLGVSTDAPASNNYAGEIIIKEGGISTALHLYTTAWRSISSNLGW